MLKIKVFENAQSFYEKEYPDDSDIKIGRADHCDLMLSSKRVSREHCRIYCKNGLWQAEDLNSQNGIRLNGAKTPSATLKKGDNLQIGDFRLEIIFTGDQQDEPPPPEMDDRTMLLSDSDASDLTIVRGPDFFQTGSEGSVDAKNFTALLKNKRLMAVLTGLFFVFLVFVFIFSSSNDPADPEKVLLPSEQEKTDAMIDMESQHRMQVYLQSGKEQFNAGNFNEALVRFQAVLNIDPENETARTYLSQCREKIIELEEQKQQAAEEEKRRMERVATIISLARQAFHQSEYTRAKEIIAEAVFLAPGDSSVAALSEEIEIAMKSEHRKKEEALIRKEENLAIIKKHFKSGQQYYDQGRYHEALKEWEQVLATGLDTPETNHVRHAITHLKALLSENIRDDYEKGKRYFSNKEYTLAVQYLNNVSRVLPDYQDTRKLLAQAVSELEAEAKKLYQEGLVYEGIGQNGKAAAKWREVMKVMPVENNEYYQKAMEKLQ